MKFYPVPTLPHVRATLMRALVYHQEKRLVSADSERAIALRVTEAVFSWQN